MQVGRGNFRWEGLQCGLVEAVILNKAGYTATPFACGWAGAVIEVTFSFGQEQ